MFYILKTEKMLQFWDKKFSTWRVIPTPEVKRRQNFRHFFYKCDLSSCLYLLAVRFDLTNWFDREGKKWEGRPRVNVVSILFA